MERILFVSSRLPYPPVGGDRLQNYNLIKILSKYYKIDLVSIDNSDLTADAKDFLNTYTTTYKVIKKTKLNYLIAAIKTMFNKRPLQVNYYYFKDVQLYIDQRINNHKYLFLFTSLIRTTRYLEKHSSFLRVVNVCDSIGINYKNSIKNVTSFFWKMIYRFESQRLINYEEFITNDFDMSFFVNPQEIQFFTGKTCLLQNGVDETKLLYSKKNKNYSKCVAFFGNMQAQHNIDAVVWFLSNVYQNLNSDIKMVVIGANPSLKLKKLVKKYSNVECTGFIEDPYEVLNGCLCVVAPLQTGAGIQNKILEAMALGTINIISSLAAIPINAKNESDYLVIDCPNQMATVINDIDSQSEKYNHLKINSRQFIKQNFTWTHYEHKLIHQLNELIK